MPYTFDLTAKALEELRRPRPYPAISLLLPTHRRAPDNAQDAIRLRNLLAEAKKRLAQDERVTREVRADVERQLDAAVADLDLSHATEGTLVLAAPGEHQVWQLPTAVPERLVIAETFLTRNLVASWLQDRPYWALVISEERSRLWQGAGESLHESEAHGFPAAPEIPDPQDAEPGANFGNHPSPYREERLRQYLRSLDDKLSAALKGAPAPVHLVGLESTLHAFEGLSRNTRHLATHVARGGCGKAPAHELAELLRPARRAHAAARQEQALARLRDALGARRFAAAPAEVWEAVHQGRAALLLVEESLQITAVPDGARLLPADAPDTPGAQEDVIDTLVESALGTDAEVVFVADGALADHGGTAAVLRY